MRLYDYYVKHKCLPLGRRIKRINAGPHSARYVIDSKPILEKHHTVNVYIKRVDNNKDPNRITRYVANIKDFEFISDPLLPPGKYELEVDPQIRERMHQIAFDPAFILQDFLSAFMKPKPMTGDIKFYYSKKKHQLHIVEQVDGEYIRTSVKKSKNDKNDFEYAFLYGMCMHALGITSSQVKKRIDDRLTPFKIYKKKRITGRPFQVKMSKDTTLLAMTQMLLEKVPSETIVSLYLEAKEAIK